MNYKFIRIQDEREIYSMDLRSYAHEEHKSFDGKYYEVCPACKHKHYHGIDGFYHDERYSKRKLCILPTFNVAHCNRCDAVFINYTDECNAVIPQFHINQKLMSEDINLATLPGINEIYKKCDKLNEAELEVLRNRNPFINPDDLGMRSMRSFDRPNILTPFYLMGKMVYYQLRFLDSEAPKVFNPSMLNKPIYIPQGCTISRDIILCEGPYDAMALMKSHPDKMPIATIGCHPTPYQLNLIRKYFTPSSITIFMDDTKKSNDVRKLVMSTPLGFYSDVSIIESDGSDPEELLREDLGLPKFIDIAKVYENYIQ